MAEFIFKDMIKKQGIEDRFYVRSAATSNEEKGNPVYPPAKKKLAENGIGCDGKTAVKMTAEDYKNYDYIIAMEKRNVENIMKINPSSSGLYRQEGRHLRPVVYKGFRQSVQRHTGRSYGIFKIFKAGQTV